MRFKKSSIDNVVILIPVIMVFVGEILSYLYPSLSSALKVITCLILLFPIWLKIKLPSKIVFFVLLFLVFFIGAFFESYNYRAALEEGVRYFFPIAVLFYGYYNKTKIKLFIYFIIVFALINFLVQLHSYYYYYIDPQRQWFYLRYFIESKKEMVYWAPSTFGVLRATGLMIFFGAFGILNFMAYWLTDFYYFGKYRKLCLCIFFVGVIISISFKTIGFFLMLLFIKYFQKLKYLLLLPPILIVLFIMIGKETREPIIEAATIRLELYVTEGNSARSESYRVMFDEIKSFNLFGEGLGSFGGPASTKYDSPYYDEVGFNWYDTKILATTDTYYPHLFVEMGLLGALAYLMIFLSPLFLKRIHVKKLKIVLIVYGVLFFDSLFSYSFNNLVILTMTLLFVYPIISNREHAVR